MLSHRLVGRQHEFLDDLFSHGTLAFYNIYRFAGFIDNNFALFKVKINRPAPHPRIAQLHRQFLHQTEILNQRTVALQQLRIFILHDFADIGIGHSFLGADHTRKDIVLHDLHMLIEFHLTGHREPVHLRIKTAYPVRQTVRQHRNYPVHQIHTASPVISFFIKL
ncbi:hypothetical protein D3C75_936030 [compost metagenome]